MALNPNWSKTDVK
jgi:hypothetical protein